MVEPKNSGMNMDRKMTLLMEFIVRMPSRPSRALREDLIFGAGLDVFEIEPPEPDNPLLKNNKVFFDKNIGTTNEIIANQIIYIKEINIQNKKLKVILELKKYDYNAMYIEEIKHFLDCVKKRKKTINDIHEGVKVLKIALQIKKSALSKRTVCV